MTIEEVEEVLKKYNRNEEIIDSKLSEIYKNNQLTHTKLRDITKLTPNIESIKKRNQQIMKELETVKGNLRSRTIFSPVEMQWMKICDNYISQPSLAGNKWKCDVPIFV